MQRLPEEHEAVREAVRAVCDDKVASRGLTFLGAAATCFASDAAIARQLLKGAG